MPKRGGRKVTSSPATEAAALRSVHTANLPALFAQLGISLVVSTYQAGKVILVRNDGGVLNTHFRTFTKPMGIAADTRRLTIGGSNTVWDYRNLPAVAQKLEPSARMTPAICPGAFMSPAISTSMNWPMITRMSCGWSTPASAACVRSMPSTASSPAGGPRLSVPWLLKTAVTSTASPQWRAGRSMSPP